MTIVVPVFNGAQVLEQTAPAVLAQPASRIVYVDDGSTDATPELLSDLASRDGRVQLVTHPVNRSRAAARNSGIARASGEVVLFLDVDVAPEVGWAESMIRAATQPGAVAAVGTLTIAEPDPQDPYHQYLSSAQRGIRSATSGPVPWKYFITAVAAIQKKVLTRAGGFDIGVDYGEDLALACRLSRHWPDGLRHASGALARQYDVGDLDTALAKLRQFAQSLPAIAQGCPEVYRLAGLEQLLSRGGIDPLLFRLARAGAPARLVRRIVGRLPKPMRPRAVRYLLAHTLAAHAPHAHAAQRP